MHGRPFDFYERTILGDDGFPEGTTFHDKLPEYVGDLGMNEIVVVDDREQWCINTNYTINRPGFGPRMFIRYVSSNPHNLTAQNDAPGADLKCWEVEGEILTLKDPTAPKLRALQYLRETSLAVPSGFSLRYLNEKLDLAESPRPQPFWGEAFKDNPLETVPVLGTIVVMTGQTSNRTYSINPTAKPHRPDRPARVRSVPIFSCKAEF